MCPGVSFSGKIIPFPGGFDKRGGLDGQFHQADVDGAEHEDPQKGLADLFDVAGAVVVAEEGAAAGGDALGGAEDDGGEALHHGGAGDPGVALGAAVAAQHDVQQDDDEVIQQRDEEGHGAYGHDAAAEGTLGAAGAQPHRHPGAAQLVEHIDGHGALGEDGGRRGAPHAQPAAEDEQRVQHQVGQGAQHHGDHSLAGVTLGQQELVHPHPQQRGHGAQQVDGEVGPGIGVEGVAAPSR